jgi:tetratricopeptide (TPR) repeat protein
MKAHHSLILALLLCGLARPAIAQALPELPRLPLDSYHPSVRAQLKQASDRAQQQPREAQTSGQLGMLLLAYEQHDTAVTCFQRTRALSPQEFRWAYYLGVVQASRGEYTEAVATLQAALVLQVDYLPAQLKLAEALLSVQRFNESQALLEKLLRAQPASSHAHFWLGKIYAAQRAIAAAIEHLRRAVELAPRFGQAHYALALVLRDAGQREQAAEHFKLSQQYKLVRPYLADPLLEAVAALNLSALEAYRKGVQLEAEGRLEQAAAEYRNALELNPQLAQAYVNLLVIHGKLNQYAQVEEVYQTALAQAPNTVELHLNYAIALLAQGNRAGAAQALQRCLEINPYYAAAHFNLGLLAEQQTKLDEAERRYRAALENDPQHRLARFHLARILVQRGELTTAIEQLQQTLTPEDENTARFRYALAAVYARAGERAKALPHARKARELALAYKQTDLLAAIERDLKLLEQR